MKIYERHYSKTQVASSSSEIFTLDFPYEAKLQKFTVQQNGGTAKPFTVVAYNFDPAGLSASDKVKYTVIPEQAAAAGNAVALFESLFMHRNMEGTPTNPVAKIYVEIVAAAAASPNEPVWEIAIGGEVVTSN